MGTRSFFGFAHIRILGKAFPLISLDPTLTLLALDSIRSVALVIVYVPEVVLYIPLSAYLLNEGEQFARIATTDKQLLHEAGG